MLKIISREVGDWMMNTILVWDEKTHKAAVFDPGADSETTISEIEKRRLEPIYLINTHGHVDHIIENHVIKSKYKIPLLIHPLDRPMLTDPMKNLSVFTGENIISPDADELIEEGQTLKIGEEELSLFHVPGHSPGSLVFYQPGLLIAGDTLFYGSIGRTDFPNCSERDLHHHIKTKIYTLPEETVVYPGHGPSTTVGHEKRTNPFVRP